MSKAVKCELCGKKAKAVVECKECKAKFCEKCGSPDTEVCEDCSLYTKETSDVEGVEIEPEEYETEYEED